MFFTCVRVCVCFFVSGKKKGKLLLSKCSPRAQMHHVDGAQKQGFVRGLTDAFSTLGCGRYFHFYLPCAGQCDSFDGGGVVVVCTGMKLIFCQKKTLDFQQHVFRRHFFTTPSSFQGLCCCYTMNVCILTADAVSPTYCWFLRVRRWKRR